MEFVQKGDADKVAEMTNSGLDPNFSSQDKTGGR